MFVVLCHKGEFAICIKTTSSKLIDSNPNLKKGCVCYEANSLPCFPLRTAIQPDNQFPIPYVSIRAAHHKGILNPHKLPEGFEGALREAIAKSVTLTPRERSRIVSLLPAEKMT